VEYILRGGSAQNNQLQADAAAYNIILPPDLDQPADCRIWAQHWPAVDLFMRCMTQWRATSGGVVGLDYGVVLEMARLYGTPDLPATMEDLQVMEVHARDLINERS
jgi:hypothetical protein